MMHLRPTRPDRLHPPRPRPLHRQGRRRRRDDDGDLRQGRRCDGKGGSMHIAELDEGMMGANGILGAGAPLACGAALAAKMPGDGDVAISFVGDGASNQGTFLESLNLAAVWNLPVDLRGREQRLRRIDLASTMRRRVDSYVDRATGFGMPGRHRRRHRFLRRLRGGRRDHRAGPRGRRPGAARMQDGPLLRPLRRRRPDLSRPGRAGRSAPTSDCLKQVPAPRSPRPASSRRRRARRRSTARCSR